MAKNKVSETLSKMIDGGRKNSPALLAGYAVVGVIALAATMWKAAPKAQRIIEGAKEELKNLDPEKDKVKRAEVKKKAVIDTVVTMAPPVVLAGTTIGAVIGSHSISTKRVALATAAYNLANQSVKDLNAQMQKTLGAQKTKELKDAIVKERHKDDKTPPKESIILTGKGDVLCVEEWCGRPFRSTAADIDRAILKTSQLCMQEMSASLNDLYDALGLEPTECGEHLGWTADDLGSGGLIPVDKSAGLNADDEPVLILTSGTLSPVNSYGMLFK